MSNYRTEKCCVGCVHNEEELCDKESVPCNYCQGYNQGRADAIDEFAKLIHKNLNEFNHHQVDFLAEQLKGENDGTR